MVFKSTSLPGYMKNLTADISYGFEPYLTQQCNVVMMNEYRGGI